MKEDVSVEEVVGNADKLVWGMLDVVLGVWYRRGPDKALLDVLSNYIAVRMGLDKFTGGIYG